jgi:hypothetical protein
MAARRIGEFRRVADVETMINMRRVTMINPLTWAPTGLHSGRGIEGGLRDGRSGTDRHPHALAQLGG